MQTNAVLLEFYGRIPPLVRAVAEDLPAEKLVERPGPDANTIGWLLWHLDRIVDRRWDPPVTMGVRLVSIADDSLQHVGQAAYVKGLLA